MARIRSVHPGFFTDEAVVSCSVQARLLLVGLWTEADDGGVFPWKPLTLKMRIFPADNVDAAELLAELERQNIVRRYEVDGVVLGAIRNFMAFQRPKAPKETHPRLDWVPEYCGMSKAKRRSGGTSDDEGGEADGDEPPPFPKISEIPRRKVTAVPPISEKPRQMEDGVGEVEDSGSSLRSDSPTAGVGPSAKASYPTVKNLPMRGGDRVYPPDFEAVWRAYPRRTEDPKDECYGHYRTAMLDRLGEPDEILAAADRWRPAMAGYDMRPGLRSWLKNRRWRDHPPKRSNGTGPPSVVRSHRDVSAEQDGPPLIAWNIPDDDDRQDSRATLPGVH